MHSFSLIHLLLTTWYDFLINIYGYSAMKKEKQEAQKRKYVPAGAMASYLRKDKQKHHKSQQSIEEQQVSISLRQKCKEPPAALVGQSQKAKGQSEKSKERPEISVIQQQIMQQQFVNHRINIHSQQETYDLVVEQQVEKHNQLPKSSIQVSITLEIA